MLRSLFLKKINVLLALVLAMSLLSSGCSIFVSRETKHYSSSGDAQKTTESNVEIEAPAGTSN